MSDPGDERAYENYEPARPPLPEHPVPGGPDRTPAVPPRPAVPDRTWGPSFLHGLPYEPFLVASTICTAIYLMTDAGGYFWPMWVMLGTGIPLLLALVGRLR
ncbi:MAG TPA: hypothetical protein VNS55_01130 [Nocardioides sp.]|nr:hypothetical protein [Nocardioides sp.]